MLHFSLIRSGLGEEKKRKRMDPHDKTRKSFIASLNRERHKNEIYASYILLLNFTLKKNKKTTLSILSLKHSGNFSSIPLLPKLQFYKILK